MARANKATRVASDVENNSGEEGMTRKDYELIARALRSGFMTQPPLPMGSEVDIYDNYRIIIGSMASALEQDNPRFNRDKFMAACGVQNCTREV